MRSHLTDKEIRKTIKKSEWGEYNELHEWETDYRYYAKLELFKQLLANSSSINESGKQILKLHFHKLKKEAGRFMTPPEELFSMLEKIEVFRT